MDTSVIHEEIANDEENVANEDLRALIIRLNAETNKNIENTQENIKQYIDKQCESLNVLVQTNSENIKVVKADVFVNKNDLADIRTELGNLQERVNNLEEDNKTLINTVEEHEKQLETKSMQIATLQYRLEDQTNRGCRRTLIVKGVPEQRKESWKETHQILVDKLVDICQLDNKEGFFNCIERVHRGKPPKPDSKKKYRDIHVLFKNWNDSQTVLRNFIKHGRGHGIYVEQHYGPDTTARRNLAMQDRRKLLDQGDITNGYVQYPAKLVVKYKEEDEDFVLHKDFSRVDVQLAANE